MKKLSIEEKQSVYEFLLEKGVPDLYAALIAERQENSMPELFTVSDTLYGGIDWVSSTEGLHFWCDLIDELANNVPEYAQNKVDIVLEDKPEVIAPTPENTTDCTIVSEQETEAPNLYLQPLDYEIKDNEVFGYIEEPYRPQQPHEYLDYLNKMKTDLSFTELTFWQKIKFYAGRLFYKV